MARLLFPDPGSRLVYGNDGVNLTLAAGQTATFYLDQAATQPADLAAFQPANPNTPGAPIPSGQLLVDAFSLLPLFWGPASGQDTLYVTVGAGPVTLITAYYDPVLDQKLNLSGGTMSGPLMLAASPTTALQAATKAYADSLVGGSGGTGDMTKAVYDPNNDAVVNAATELVDASVFFQGAVSKGDPVYVSGVNGAQIMMNKANAANQSTLPAVGLAAENYGGGQVGTVVLFGPLSGMATGSYQIGQYLYVAVGGGLTNVRPAAPNIAQMVCVVLRTGGNDGVVGVAAQPASAATILGVIMAGRFAEASVQLVDAATIVTDASLGNIFRVTLGGNRLLGNPTGVVDGQRLLWEFLQDGAGNRNITLDAKFVVATSLLPINLSVTAGKRDFLRAIYNATTDKFYVDQFVKGL
jgi:hypothetical protein